MWKPARAWPCKTRCARLRRGRLFYGLGGAAGRAGRAVEMTLLEGSLLLLWYSVSPSTKPYQHRLVLRFQAVKVLGVHTLPSYTACQRPSMEDSLRLE